MITSVAAHPDQQRCGPVTERLMRQPPRDHVPQHTLGTARATPRIRLHDPALQSGTIQVLPSVHL